MGLSNSSKWKDVEVENEAEKRLMCGAHNCSNRWSVDAGQGRLCSAHAWSDPMDWGRITSEVNSRALMRQTAYQEPVEPMSLDEKRYVLNEFKKIMAPRNDHKDWAKRLRQRESDGEILNDIQRKMWRAALRVES